jgi:hypothetical protein
MKDWWVVGQRQQVRKFFNANKDLYEKFAFFENL